MTVKAQDGGVPLTNPYYQAYTGENDPTAIAVLKKYGKSCKRGTTQWGNLMVPKK